MSVELRHLRAFAAIAAEGSITGAAARLAITQPALSRTLRQLEQSMGRRLVDRSTSHLRLSADGLAFLPKVEAALAAVDDALDPATLRAWPLRVGHAWSAASSHTPAIMHEWSARRPDVPLELVRIDDRYAGLTSGRADMALLRGTVDEPTLLTETLYVEPRVAVLPTGHALAAATDLALADLVGESLVVNTVSGTTTLGLWPPGPRPRIAARVGTTEDWALAIAGGRGIGITPSSTGRMYANPGTVQVPLRDAPAVPVVLARRRGPGHPARDEFAEVAREAVAAGTT